MQDWAKPQEWARGPQRRLGLRGATICKAACACQRQLLAAAKKPPHAHIDGAHPVKQRISGREGRHAIAGAGHEAHQLLLQPLGHRAGVERTRRVRRSAFGGAGRCPRRRVHPCLLLLFYWGGWCTPPCCVAQEWLARPGGPCSGARQVWAEQRRVRQTVRRKMGLVARLEGLGGRGKRPATARGGRSCHKWRASNWRPSSPSSRLYLVSCAKLRMERPGGRAARAGGGAGGDGSGAQLPARRAKQGGACHTGGEQSGAIAGALLLEPPPCQHPVTCLSLMTTQRLGWWQWCIR